jgi:hypothetical protein
VVKVKPHCRHPPQRAWQKAAKSAADWGWWPVAKCARCSAPASVCVCGYTRKAGKRRKKRKTTRKAPPPGQLYFVCESSTPRTCGVHHRRFAAAAKHARQLRRKESLRRAYFGGNRPRTKRPKLTTWHVEPRKGWPMIPAAALANLGMWAGVSAALADAGHDATNAAIITGVLGLVNTVLQTIILRQARRNAELTRSTRHEVRGAKETAREGVQVLREATGTEKRKQPDRRPPERGGGRRRDDDG